MGEGHPSPDHPSGRDGRGKGRMVVYLLLLVWLESMIGISDATATDFILTRKLRDSVIYDQTIDAPDSCYCKTRCLVKPECTGHTRYTDDNGKISCFYSNVSPLSYTNTGSNISSVTFFNPGTLGTPLTQEQEQIAFDCYKASLSTVCQEPYFSIPDHAGCFFIVAYLKIFNKAKFFCGEVNGELYIAPSETDYYKVKDYMRSSNPGDLWVDVKSRKWGGDGRDVTEWRSGGYNGAADECARMNPGEDYNVDDRYCTKNYKFLCWRA